MSLSWDRGVDPHVRPEKQYWLNALALCVAAIPLGFIGFLIYAVAKK